MWGDEDWWARRTPALATAAKDQWVQADDGTALPIDLAAEFTPAALAELVRNIDDYGTTDRDVTAYQGIPVIAKTWEDWTLIRTQALPAKALSLSGPIDQGLFHTAAAPHATVEAVSAVWDGEAPAPHPQAGGGAGTLTLEAPSPAPPATATTTKETTTNTLGGSTDAETAAPPRGSADIEVPPDIASFITPLPSLTGSINATTCSTPTCTWSATVQNIGEGPGDVTATVSATPGMGSQTIPLGTIQPGSSASTGTLSFANPAPTPRPGQTTSVMVNYSLVTYTDAIGGSNAARYRELVDRLGGYLMQPLLDQVMQQLDAGLKDPAVEAMHSMLDDDVPPEEVLAALDEAGRADPARGEYSEMPMLRQLAAAGDRFTSWAPVVDRLTTVSPIELPYYLPGLETAASELNDPAAPTVALTYPEPTTAGQTQPAVVVSAYPESETKCIGVVSVPDGDLAASIDQAVSVAQSGADSCTVSARIVHPTELPYVDPVTVQRRLLDAVPDLTACDSGNPNFTELTITTVTGTASWPAAVVCAATAAEREQTEIDLLNELALAPELVGALEGLGLVTVADGQITDVDKRKDDPDCKSEYEYGPTAPLDQGSAFWRSGGTVASGAAAYLCGTLPAGEETSGQRPWDYPSENFEIDGAWAFAACHLVGNQLGGSVAPGNLVTCHHPTTNNRDMKGLENAIASSVSSESHILYLVTPYYNGTPEEAGRPSPLSGIRVTAIGLGKGTLWLDVCFVNGWNGGHVPGSGCA
ncbi:DNA/RNA non-specific endonuclease [Glycomyces rhizosphaerae]|uniref:DNA/RNA non-specific endonuclease n=1 Tax=Glycomyces rhizosphaerae TaxID=2054422 RepID=A0ABV7PZL8_9ACTN